MTLLLTDPEPPGDNRPSVYIENGITVIRASALGGCLWELVAEGQGLEPGELPDVLTRAFIAGHDLEPVVLGRMAREGWDVGGEQVEGELKINDRVVVRFHPDGIGTPPASSFHASSMRVVEIKCLNDQNWNTCLLHGARTFKEGYAWQLSVMMYALDLPATWVYYNKRRLDPKVYNEALKPGVEETEEMLSQGKGLIAYDHIATPPIPLLAIARKAEEVDRLVRGPDILTTDLACDTVNEFACRYKHYQTC